MLKSKTQAHRESQKYVEWLYAYSGNCYQNYIKDTLALTDPSGKTHKIPGCLNQEKFILSTNWMEQDPLFNVLAAEGRLALVNTTC